MIRTSRHSLKFITKEKRKWLDMLFEDYRKELQNQIYLIWTDVLPLKKFSSSKNLEGKYITHSQWIQKAYRKASEIVRICLSKDSEGYNYPKVKNSYIDFYSVDIKSKETGDFDCFVKLKLPYKKKGKLNLKIPIKEHSHSKKFLKDGWIRKDTVRLIVVNGHYYLEFFWEKEKPELKIEGTILGVDQGVSSLMITSKGLHIGKEMNGIYNRLVEKQRGSLSFKKLKKYKDQLVNHFCKKIDLTNVKELVLEKFSVDFRKKRSNRTKRFRNKFQYWTYSKVINKLEQLCEENGVLFTQVNPSYTSQTCSHCGSVHEENRNGKHFKCIDCSYSMDADINAAINISRRGFYISSCHKKGVEDGD